MSDAAASPARQAVAGPALRGLGRFASARGIPPGLEFVLDYDVIEAFCVAGPAGRAPATRGTYRSALYRPARPGHREAGGRAAPLPGARAPPPPAPADRAQPCAVPPAPRAPPAPRPGPARSLLRLRP